ncbi:hypothetical protein DFH07DRAFT_770044 [Mycena maculata]|uniref:Uncharacterized protein n=1 Tax=Mycena maculata TaxID=230809 RepID=A0AAD7JJ41_9AGAR|nr:hypothetical protein DFH07DRAFT_770044 [Mycena maculata]
MVGALLATKPNFTAAVTPTASASASVSMSNLSSPSHTNTAAIVGGVVFLLSLGIAVMLWTRSRKRRADNLTLDKIDAFPAKTEASPQVRPAIHIAVDRSRAPSGGEYIVTPRALSDALSTMLLSQYSEAPSTYDSRQAYIRARMENQRPHGMVGARGRDN